MYKSKESIEAEFDQEFVKNNLWKSDNEDTSFVGIGNIKDFIHKTREEDRVAIVEEVEEWAIKNKKGHSSIIQLGVFEQATVEGKMHYQNEYGKKDGYNQALTDLKVFLSNIKKK
jgi:hypothetical protein